MAAPVVTLQPVHAWRIDTVPCRQNQEPIALAGIAAGAAPQAHQHISASVKDHALARKMLPDYDLGCKRILISDNFYRAVNRDNVNVITQGLERIDHRGPLTPDGEIDTLYPYNARTYQRDHRKLVLADFSITARIPTAGQSAV